MVRYKIAPDVFRLVLEDGRAVSFDHGHYTYWVDILESNRGRGLLRIHMPDGELVTGWQSLDWVTLHNRHELYDGRFNSSSGV